MIGSLGVHIEIIWKDIALFGVLEPTKGVLLTSSEDSATELIILEIDNLVTSGIVRVIYDLSMG